MKKAILALVIAMTLGAYVRNAKAEEIGYETPLRVVQISPELPFALTATGANLLIAPTQRLLVLSVTQKRFCAPDTICIDVLPKAVEFRLTLAAPRQDECGVRTYIARNNRRSSNEPLVEITVTDHSRNLCTSANLALTQVELRTTDTEGNKTLSEFDGDRLVPKNLTPLFN